MQKESYIAQCQSTGAGVARLSPSAITLETWLVKVLRFGGVTIMALSRAKACEILIECAVNGPTRPMDVHLCNAYTVALADKSQPYRQLLNDGGLNLPDGLSVVWGEPISHWGERATMTQARGTDLFLDVFEAGNQPGLRHYLLGSTKEVLEALTNNLYSYFPGVQIVGTENPPIV